MTTPLDADVLGTMQALHEISRRLFRNGMAVARLAANFVEGMDTKTAISACRRHAAAGGPASSDVSKIIEEYEQSLSEADRDVLLRKKNQAVKNKFRHNVEREEVVDLANLPPDKEWAWKVVMEQARYRRDTIACAIMAVERSDGEARVRVSDALWQYMTGQASIHYLEHWAKEAGFTGSGNVVPLVPVRRAR